MVDERTAHFAKIAKDYCSVVTASPLEPRAVLTCLLRLLVAANELPSDTPSFGNSPAPWSTLTDECAAISANVADTLGSADRYWMVFDPRCDEAPCVGSLSDDLSDIYRDLRRGLEWFDREAPHDAAWEWRFTFESHWGNHATDAVRALHRLVHT